MTQWDDKKIIRCHAILNSRKLRIPDKVCKLHSIARDLIQFRTQINNSISKQIYSSSKELIFHGVGQGIRNEYTYWTFISIRMMEDVEDVSQECTIPLPQEKKHWTINILCL